MPDKEYLSPNSVFQDRVHVLRMETYQNLGAVVAFNIGQTFIENPVLAGLLAVLYEKLYPDSKLSIIPSQVPYEGGAAEIVHDAWSLLYNMEEVGAEPPKDAWWYQEYGMLRKNLLQHGYELPK